MSANTLNVANLIRYQFQIAQLSVNLMQKYQPICVTTISNRIIHDFTSKLVNPSKNLFSIDIKGCSFHCCELSLKKGFYNWNRWWKMRAWLCALLSSQNMLFWMECIWSKKKLFDAIANWLWMERVVGQGCYWPFFINL